jgi:DNA topoisomerase-1
MSITRRKKGRQLLYYLDEKIISDTKEILRITKLAIPPAWSDVEIAESARARVQAKGYDAAGRIQAIYNPAFRQRQEKLKYERILKFAKALPKLRRQLKKDLARKKLGKEKVLACIVSLIDDEFFRVGNERYARENHSYGITTLRSKHATITRSTVTFDFVGKSGKEHIKTVKDAQIARIIRQLDEMPGYEIFRYQDDDGRMHDITSHDVNAYIKQYMGDDFTAKDFRTWGGTLLATSAILTQELDTNASKTERAKVASAIVKQVAKRLGNTPAIARSSYIDPRVFKAFEDMVTIGKIKKVMTKMKPKKYLTVEEQCVLKVLDRT